MSYQKYLEAFWKQYTGEIPVARKIYTLFQDQGEQFGFLDHDHMALRTFNDPRVGIDVIMKPFVAAGYRPARTYDFPIKGLFARHYEPPTPEAPKIFISELLLEQFSKELQTYVQGFLNKIPKSILNNSDELFLSKTIWGELDYNVYSALLEESQYAAWMYAYGYRANHFAVKVNSLKHFRSCQEINAFLTKNGYKINQANGEVKGSADQLLEQSSIMADDNKILFSDGAHLVPSCYYEFTKRYAQENGQLYEGFIASSADKIFQSTDVVKSSDPLEAAAGHCQDDPTANQPARKVKK